MKKLPIPEEHQDEIQTLLDEEHAAKRSMDHFSDRAASIHKRLWKKINETFPETKGAYCQLNGQTLEVIIVEPAAPTDE